MRSRVRHGLDPFNPEDAPLDRREPKAYAAPRTTTYRTWDALSRQEREILLDIEHDNPDDGDNLNPPFDYR